MTNKLVYAGAFFLSLAISYFATPYVQRLAVEHNVIVQPGGRRVHDKPMPLWGGIAIFGSFALTCLLILFGLWLKHGTLGVALPLIGLLISGTIILVMGMIDDMKDLSAAIQTGTIVLAAFILMAFGARIHFLSNPFGHPKLIILHGALPWIVSLAWIFLVTKTFDFMDGLDGLAAGIGAIASGVLAMIAFFSGNAQVTLMSATLCGACIGFLRYNFNPAKIFMGTGGSQFIGFCLAAISIRGLFKIYAAMAIALPVLVLGVPILDGLFVVFKRILKGQPIHIADRSHLHHRLLARGLTHKQAVCVIYTISILLGVAAIYIFLRLFINAK